MKEFKQHEKDLENLKNLDSSRSLENLEKDDIKEIEAAPSPNAERQENLRGQPNSYDKQEDILSTMSTLKRIKLDEAEQAGGLCLYSVFDQDFVVIDDEGEYNAHFVVINDFVYLIDDLYAMEDFLFEVKEIVPAIKKPIYDEREGVLSFYVNDRLYLVKDIFDKEAEKTFLILKQFGVVALPAQAFPILVAGPFLFAGEAMMALEKMKGSLSPFSYISEVEPTLDSAMGVFLECLVSGDWGES